MGEVIHPPIVTRLKLPPERFLRKALEEDLETVVILGQYAEGKGFFFSSSNPDGGTVLWLFERAKTKLMQIADDSESGD